MSVRSHVKNTALEMLRTTGIFSLYANSGSRRRRLLILCYHGLSLRDEHEWRGGLFITPTQFQQRLAFLKSLDVHVLDLTEALQRLQTNSLPERSAVITFDDGFYDFHRHAAPLLASAGFPATLYLTTHYCDYRLPIFNLITNYMLWKNRGRVVDLSSLKLPPENDLSREDTRQHLTVLLNQQAAALNTVAKDELAQQLAEALQVDYPDLVRSRILQILSPEEATALSRGGIDLQLHTHRHRTPRDRALFTREILDNSHRLQEFSGRKPVHFCYPSGDHAPEFLPWLKECGVQSATTCALGLAKSNSEPLLLPRLLDATNISPVDFESWVCGFRS
jgi:peptidoglycan/xylan/chitin deacetylase (PgdA/CDA1 family)